MYNKNSKSNSNVVKEAEQIIENYINKRKIQKINKNINIEEKYERLKILCIALCITFCIGVLLNIILK